MSRAATKKKAALATTKPVRHRVAHQITISPECTEYLAEAVERFGPGTKSMLIDMAIRNAKRCGLFDGDLLGGGGSANNGNGPTKRSTIEETIIEQLPSLIQRLLDNAKAG